MIGRASERETQSGSMAVTSRVVRAVRKALAVVVVSFVVFTIFVLPTNVPSGMRALQIIRNFDGRLKSGEVGDIISNHSTGESGKGFRGVALQDPQSQSEESETKVMSLVDRILEMEELIAHFISRRGGFEDDNRQLSQLELVANQLKLVKSLLEKSVFIMKLEDLESHERHTLLLPRMDSTSWIAWDHLEPATSELEREVRLLVFGAGTRRLNYGSKRMVATTSLLLLGVVAGLVFYAVKLTPCAKARSAESMV